MAATAARSCSASSSRRLRRRRASAHRRVSSAHAELVAGRAASLASSTPSAAEERRRSRRERVGSPRRLDRGVRRLGGPEQRLGPLAVSLGPEVLGEHVRPSPPSAGPRRGQRGATPSPPARRRSRAHATNGARGRREPQRSWPTIGSPSESIRGHPRRTAAMRDSPDDDASHHREDAVPHRADGARSPAEAERRRPSRPTSARACCADVDERSARRTPVERRTPDERPDGQADDDTAQRSAARAPAASKRRVELPDLRCGSAARASRLAQQFAACRAARTGDDAELRPSATPRASPGTQRRDAPTRDDEHARTDSCDGDDAGDATGQALPAPSRRRPSPFLRTFLDP